MASRKCISCGAEFEEKKELKEIKVTLPNPGEIFCEGIVITCPKCKEDYADHEDMLKLAENFEKACESKKFKK
ncbi:MAG: hypothetical protein V1839_01220 [archaeon]